MDGCRWPRGLQCSRPLTAAGANGNGTGGPAATTVPSLSGQETEDGFRLASVPDVADLDRGCLPEAAVYELLRLEDAAWRHGFVAYLRHRHEAGLAGDGRLTGAELATHLAVASDIRVLRKTKAVMEAAHRGHVLSLAELARAGDGPVEDRRKREVGLRERVLWPMDELGAWDVAEVPRMLRSATPAPTGPGGTRLAARGVLRYEIGAGPALRAFDALHYRPWLLRQLERLGVTLGPQPG